MTLGLSTLSAEEVQAKKHSFSELIEIIDGPKRKYDFVDKYDAFYELGKLNSEAAAKELASRITGKWGHAAASALADMDNVAAVPIVIKALSSADVWERSVLCGALGNMGGDDAARTLVDLMDNDADKWVRRQAVYALRKDAQRRPTGIALKALVRSLDTKELVSIIKRVLWTVRDKAAGPSIRKLLSSPDEDTRAFACDWIRAQRDSGSTNALFKLLKSERDQKVIANATLTLSVVHTANRSEDVTKLLTKGLSGSAPSKALSALGRTLRSRTSPLSPKVASALIRSVHRLFKHDDPEVARLAVIIAGQIGDPSTASLAIPFLSDKSRYMQSNALDAVAATMTKPAQAKALLAAVTKENHLRSRYSGIKKRKGVAKLLLPGLKSQERHVRSATAEILRRQADPIAAPALLAALKKETDRSTRGAIADALKACRNTKVVTGMASLLASKSRVNVSVLEAFVSLDRQQGFKASKAVLAKGGVVAQNLVSRVSGLAGDEVLFQWAANHKEPNVRRAAATQLANIKSLGSVGLLCKLLRDSDDSTRTSAAKSLGRIPRAGSARCLIDAIPRAKKTVLWKESIYRALRELSGEKFANEPAPWKAWHKSNMGLGKGVPGLAVALQSDSRDRMVMAANATARLRAKDARRLLPALLGALEKTHNTEARVVIIGAVATAGAPSSGALLRKDLDRVSAIPELIARTKALRSFGDDSGLQILVDKLGEKRSRDREMIAAALSDITAKSYTTDAVVWQSRMAKRVIASK